MSGCRFIHNQTGRSIVFLVMLLNLTVQSAAQSATQSKTEQQVTKKDEIYDCNTLGMFVEVEVRDRRGKNIPALNWKNFSLFEDRVQQGIEAFRQIDESVKSKYVLLYYPTNIMFDGKQRKVLVLARANKGQALRVSSHLKLNPFNECDFKVSTDIQGNYSVELPLSKK